MRKGGSLLSKYDPIHLSEENKGDFLKTNMIVGKLMKPVVQSNISQQSPPSILRLFCIWFFNRQCYRAIEVM